MPRRFGGTAYSLGEGVLQGQAVLTDLADEHVLLELLQLRPAQTTHRIPLNYVDRRMIVVSQRQGYTVLSMKHGVFLNLEWW
jgi:hypothetical protein